MPEFKNRERAEGFAAGVEYGDSSYIVGDIIESPKGYVVPLIDKEDDEDASVPARGTQVGCTLILLTAIICATIYGIVLVLYGQGG